MAAPITGQVTVTVSAQSLDATSKSVNCVAFALKAPATNSNTVYIGPASVTTANGFPLTPGDEFEYQRLFNQITPTLQCTPADFFAVGTAGSDVLAWFATPLMANFPKSPPAVGRSTGLRGQNGATGATGNGAVFTAVDSLHASPRLVADWGPTLNTAIAGGTTHFVFGPFAYPFSTRINLAATLGVVFEGTSGLIWPAQPNNRPATQLIWKGGAGTGQAIALAGLSVGAGAAGADGFVCHDLAIYYDNAAFDGDLVFHGYPGGFNPTAYCIMERCTLGAYTYGVTSARSLVNLTGAVDPKIIRCSFQGAQNLIVGSMDTAAFANDVEVYGCIFSSWTYAAVCNPLSPQGDYWIFRDCTWEFTTANPAAFDSNIGTIGTPILCYFILDNCRFWDGTFTGQVAVNQRQTAVMHIEVRGGFFEIDKLFLLNGPGSFTLRGEIANVRGTLPYIDLGNPATALKSYVFIEPGLVSVSAGAPIAHISGHPHVIIRGTPQLTGTLPAQQQTIVAGAERASFSAPASTAALHGTPAGVASIWAFTGTDMAGVIIIRFSGTAVSAGELIADVTFGTPIPIGAAIGFAHRLPVVVLSPIVISGNANGANTTGLLGASAFATVVDNENTGTDQTGWTFGIVNAITPALGNYGWAYRVTEL